MSTHWALHLIHFLYATFLSISTWLQRRKRRQPNPLKAQRSKKPSHLCLNLVANSDMSVEETESAFIQCLQRVAAWCRELGIEALTVYDRHGVLYGCSEDVRQRVFPADEILEDSCESEIEYPLTPPPSESSGSRPHSPERAVVTMDLNTITMTDQVRLRKRRQVAVRRLPKALSSTPNNLTLYITSRASGKLAVVSASRALLQGYVGGALMSGHIVPSGFGYNLTVSKLGAVLEAGLPPPDLMIIHHVGNVNLPQLPIEFHGLPPWQNTLTEFHPTLVDDYISSETPDTLGLVSEAAFCRALDEYSKAEFRLGR